MKMLVTITPAVRSLVDDWLAPSLRLLDPAPTLVTVVDRSLRARGNGDFRTRGFGQHIFTKFRLIARWARKEREPFFVSDADIIYLRPFEQAAQALIAEHDIVLSREIPGRDDYYNIGQMVVRPSPEVAAFFRRMADELSAGAIGDYGAQQPANQDHVNAALQTSGLRHTALPVTFANAAHWDELGPDRRDRVISYHATGTFPQPGRTSLEQKHERLRVVSVECDVALGGASTQKR